MLPFPGAQAIETIEDGFLNFGAQMRVELVNDGPVTFVLEDEPARSGQ